MTHERSVSHTSCDYLRASFSKITTSPKELVATFSKIFARFKMGRSAIRFEGKIVSGSVVDASVA